MAEPGRAPAAPPPVETNMTRIYVGVLVVEAVVLAALYLLQRVYS